jgi:hypothetical protein
MNGMNYRTEGCIPTGESNSRQELGRSKYGNIIPGPPLEEQYQGKQREVPNRLKFL